MFNNKVSKAVRLAIAFGAASTAALASTAVSAEENTETDKVERIQVTGSKIKRQGLTSPTPVTVITGEQLVAQGITNVNDLLRDLPAGEVGNSPETTTSTIYASGLNTYNLRNLGSSRTLVLVDGRRFVGSGPTSNAVDLNNIPASMIERIEVTTGGASAVYGADAVAGVVNIVTKTSFDGVKVQLDTRRPQQSGGERDSISITGGYEGSDFSFISTLEYNDAKSLAKMDRDFFRTPVESYRNPANETDSDFIPRMLSHERREGYGLYASQGNFLLGPFNADTIDNRNYTFDGNGNIRNFDYGAGRLPDFDTNNPVLNYIQTDELLGDGIAHGNRDFFNTPLERITFGTNFEYRFADEHRLTASVFYGASESATESSPSFHRHTIRRDNAYMKQDMKDLLDNYTNADGEVSPVSQVTLYQMSDKLGNREFTQDRESINLSVGVDGFITDNWAYTAYIQYGKNENESVWKGEVFTQNLANAVDAVLFEGNVVCADRDDEGNVVGALAGCTPLNVMNIQDLSADQANYILTEASNVRSAEMYSAGVTVDGTIYELPAGPLATAISLERRKNESETNPSENMQAGTIFNNSSQPFLADISVTEASIELSVPLIADVNYIQDLTFETAYRYMDYSVTGSDNAWKLGLNYSVNDELSFRGTRSKSVRAPNLGQLFTNKSTTYGTRIDVCTAESISNSASRYIENIKRNCAADGVPVDFQPSQEWRTAGSLVGYIDGNPDLENEVSHDLTIGFAYSPSQLEGFDITLDYWEFEITGALQSFDEEVIELCYESESLDNPFCPNVIRDPNTREITEFYQRTLNAAVINRKGIDFESQYRFDAFGGEIVAGLTATYNILSDENTTGRLEDYRNYTGEVDTPRVKGRLNVKYQADSYFVGATVNYRSSTVNDRNDWTVETNNYNDVSSYTRVELRAGVDITEDLTVTARIKNLFDVEPPRTPLTFDDGEFFDIYGRTLSLSASYQF
ncbi:TonB-dependent receptor [Pseudoalteromonas sp. PS5]|uniref:TonB-dependent receptor domain-containing protein n=1 Tax=Pseudoalteromonas sp. PS5 TaxID=1437473 RepID=UPI000FFF44D6|nr:TonB-dependent receptor [Pseudoalteromonas sp. PS5]RXF05823.1 TonB-dependent receptor [Pseudoalteromonas sp. PS5]